MPQEIIVDGWLQKQVSGAEAGYLSNEIRLPRALIRMTKPVRVRKSNIFIIGAGKGHQHDAPGDADAGTALLWGGPLGVAMFEFAPNEGSTARRISGGGIVGCGFYGNGVAPVAISIKSMMGGTFDIYGENFLETVMRVGVVGQLGEARDSQQNVISIFGKQVDMVSGKILELTGDAGANASWNYFPVVHGLYKHVTAIHLMNSDNNLFQRTWLFRFGGGAAHGVIFGGGSPPSRANRFEMLYPGAGGVLVQRESYRNVIDIYDNENAPPTPVVLVGDPSKRRLTWGNWDGERFLW